MTTENRARASVATLRRHVPEDLITFRISVLSQLLARVVEGSVRRELSLSSRQWRVLVMLNRLGPATSGQVAAATRLDHSQVSRASHELAGKGLVAMGSDQADRRRQFLSVTPAGTQVLRRGIVGSQARQARLRARLTKADYEVLGRTLATLADEAQKMLAETRGSGRAKR
ncbi:MAG: MarR family winged helix-turn-helix transcriptional regulator [Burkholderiaceae bacterium]